MAGKLKPMSQQNKYFAFTKKGKGNKTIGQDPVGQQKYRGDAANNSSTSTSGLQSEVPKD